MEPEDLAEIGDMPGVSVPMKVRVIALSAAFMVLVGLGLWASSPLMVRFLEAVQEYAALTGDLPDDGSEAGPESSPEPSTPQGASVHVVMRDSFEQQDPGLQRRTFTRGTGTARLCDGCMFMSLSEGSTDREFSKVWLNYGSEEMGDPWLFVDVEIRLRLSDNSDLEGGGMRCWGLMEGTVFPENSILLVSQCPKSDAPGLFIKSREDGQILADIPISGIDTAEWHNYTILWGPHNSTVLVDGVSVARIEDAPSVPMAVHVQAENTRYVQEGSHVASEGIMMDYISLDRDVWVEVESVRVNMAEGRYREYSAAVLARLDEVSRQMGVAREKEVPTDRIQLLHANAEEDWEDNGHIHATLFSELVEISEKLGVMLEHADELMELFSDAGEALNEFAASEGEKSRRYLVNNAYMEIAKNGLDKYDHETARHYLMRIIGASEELSGS